MTEGLDTSFSVRPFRFFPGTSGGGGRFTYTFRESVGTSVFNDSYDRSSFLLFYVFITKGGVGGMDGLRC